MDKTSQIHSALREFASARCGLCPAPHVLGAAYRLAQAAIESAVDPEATIEDKGEFSLTAGISDGRVLTFVVAMDGRMSGQVRNPETEVLVLLDNLTEGQLWLLLHN